MGAASSDGPDRKTNRMDRNAERLDIGEFDFKRSSPGDCALSEARGSCSFGLRNKISGAAMLMAALHFSAGNSFESPNTFGGEEEMGQLPEENGSERERASGSRANDRKPVDFVVPRRDMKRKSSVVSWNE